MIFHIAVCSPDPVLRGRVQRHCMEYYARRADACIVEQLESTAALLIFYNDWSRYEIYIIELPATNPCCGLQAAAELRRRGVRAPLAFLAHTTAYAYEAFRVDAMQYLHIPFRPEQLTALLDRATEPEYGPVIPVATAMGLRVRTYSLKAGNIIRDHAVPPPQSRCPVNVYRQVRSYMGRVAPVNEAAVLLPSNLIRPKSRISRTSISTSSGIPLVPLIRSNACAIALAAALWPDPTDACTMVTRGFCAGETVICSGWGVACMGRGALLLVCI